MRAKSIETTLKSRKSTLKLSQLSILCDRESNQEKKKRTDTNNGAEMIESDKIIGSSIEKSSIDITKNWAHKYHHRQLYDIRAEICQIKWISSDTNLGGKMLI